MKGISGTPQTQVPTSCSDAWLGGYYATIRLAQDVEAVSVQVGAGVAAAANQVLSTGAGSVGRWFAVGDVILTRSAYTGSRPPSGIWKKVEWCVLKAGSIVNVGQCHPLFGHGGGADQIEFVSGPAPERTTVVGNWADTEGHT